jgi:hypothetical protein
MYKKQIKRLKNLNFVGQFNASLGSECRCTIVLHFNNIIGPWINPSILLHLLLSGYHNKVSRLKKGISLLHLASYNPTQQLDIFRMHDALMDATNKKMHRIMWKFPQHLKNKIISYECSKGIHSSATTSISLTTAHSTTRNINQKELIGLQ